MSELVPQSPFERPGGRVALIRQFDHSTAAWLDTASGDLRLLRRELVRHPDGSASFAPAVAANGWFDVLDGHLVCWYELEGVQRVRVDDVDVPVTDHLRSRHGLTRPTLLRCRCTRTLARWLPLEQFLELYDGDRRLVRIEYARPRIRERFVDAWLDAAYPWSSWPKDDEDYDLPADIHLRLGRRSRQPADSLRPQ